ncbi:MAG: C4-dicarboxylate ABC transporter [Deltaproteobacteria bacterium]|nr:C4-dicarboxylate ABC transporter [Deltaproteobacteria bacterium]
MNVPVLSLILLVIAVLISCFTPLNIGALAVGFSLIIGYVGNVKVGDIVKGYPANLLLLLAGTTYLFSIAQTNGTLDKVARYAVKMVRGRAALLPIVLFFLAFGLSAMGPGQITISALLAPISMMLAAEVGISPLLMALVVGNGAQAGAMSPLAPPGIISANLLAKQGLTGVGGVLWLNMLIVHVAVTVLAYFLFGGLKLWKEESSTQAESLKKMQVEPFDRAQIATLAGIGLLVAAALFFTLAPLASPALKKLPEFHIGLGAFLIGAMLSLGKVVDEPKAIKAMPWATILMVTGVTVLVELMKNVGGIDLFARLIAKMSTPGTVTLVAGFWSGLVSAYASTTGVILPAFLPMASPLLKELGGGNLLALVSSIIVCGFVVDLSPLSTTGAVFIANAQPTHDKNKLFRDMLIWGFSMAVVGAVVSWLAFTVLGLP